MEIIFIPFPNRPIFIPVFSENGTDEGDQKLVNQFFLQSHKILKKAIKENCDYEYV